MKNAVIIHGWGATSESNWFPWLKTQLEKNDFLVTIPDFPNSQHPILTEWFNHFKKEVAIDEETILIGHSLGSPFILKFLEQQEIKIKSAFLVAGFERSLDIPEIENFVDKPFNFEAIKKASDKFYVISSDNDPYIDLPIATSLAQNLETQLIVEQQKGHLNEDIVYPRLLDLILNSTSSY